MHNEKIETVNIIGRTRDYKKHTTEIPVMHIAFRANKEPFSTIDKFLRKEHGTFDEILDQKGIIMVVDKFSDENNFKVAEMLIKILENELATLRSSWIEYPEFKEKLQDNENTSAEFNVLKGVMKIPSKAKELKSRINTCQDEINGLKKSGNLDTLRHRKNILKLESEIEALRKQFANLRYNLPLEVQIFDMEGYLKASIDPESPAHHSRYKEYQRIIELFPLFFPVSIYGEESLRNILLPKIEEKIKTEMNLV